jgi:peptidoglycan/LPS O-acetylase OafA/YrhL
MSKPSTLLDGVQYLRGLCAVVVVISHCNGIIGKPEHYSKMALPDWHIASLFAVATFFSISGFIIVIASLDANAMPRTSRAEFLLRRFVRIVPFLWLCTLGYNLLSWAGTGALEWPAALRTLIVWPVGELKPNVAWSLRHELLFYLLYAVAMLGSGRKPALLLIWFALSAAFYVISYDIGLGADVSASAWFEALKVFMGGDHGANFQFAAGMGLAYVYVRQSKAPGSVGKLPPIALLAWTAATCAIVSLVPLDMGLPLSLLWTVLAIPVLASAIWARPGRGVAGRLGLVLGNASFSIYLVHNPIVLVLLAAAQKSGMTFNGQPQLLGFLAFCVVVTTLGGIVVHYLVEAPLIRACSGWIRRDSRQPSAAAAP